MLKFGMTYTIHKSSIRTIKQQDPNFLIKDNLVVAKRAGFEIDQSCPREYSLILQECITRGWLKPIAYMSERELMISGLLQE